MNNKIPCSSLNFFFSQESHQQAHRRNQYLQSDAVRSRLLLQQDPVLLLRRADSQPRRGGGPAGVLLHRSGLRERPEAGVPGQHPAQLHLLRIEGQPQTALALRPYEQAVEGVTAERLRPASSVECSREQIN